MNLAAYLERIGYHGVPAPTRATLEAVQRLHLLAIPYENIDVQLGRPLTIDPAAAFDKIVTRRRGGWCFEMNGVLGWALSEMGFRVTRLPSGVFRSLRGDAAVGNHLVLRLDLEDGPLLADVGIGDGPMRPYAVVEGPFSADGFDFRIERIDERWWRLHNHPQGMAANFDFQLDQSDEPLMARTCLDLQSNPKSIFVLNLVCQRFVPDGGQVQLRGRVLRRMTPQGTTERVLGSCDEFVDTLAQSFAIEDG